MSATIVVITKVLLLVLASSVLVHLFAIFGVFIAVIYPVLWLFSPNLTYCFFCSSKKSGGYCPVCKQEAQVSERYPKTLYSVIINGLILLMFSLISIGVVFVESKILSYIGISPIKKTAIMSIPTKGQYRVDEVFQLPIEISGLYVPVNAIQADIGFDSKSLKLIDISTEGSFANIFLQKEINNENGYARLTGGLPNPGYSGDRGLFATLYFKAKAPGFTRVQFLPSSMVLANDGRGSNILKSTSVVDYLIRAERAPAEQNINLPMPSPTNGAVMGTNTNRQDDQIMLFNDKAQVLGQETTGQNTNNNASKNPFTVFLELLTNVDIWILDTWKTLITSIFERKS